MAPNYVFPIRVAQAVLAIIVLGLTAYVVNVGNGYSPDSVNFLLFTSLWTLLAVAFLFLAPIKFPQAAHKFAIAGVEFVTMIFWFAGFVAVAALWGDWRGTGVSWYDAGTAAIVFGAFEWLLFLATTVLAGLHVWNTRNTHDDRAPPEMETHPGV